MKSRVRRFLQVILGRLFSLVGPSRPISLILPLISWLAATGVKLVTSSFLLHPNPVEMFYACSLPAQKLGAQSHVILALSGELGRFTTI
jgi:hypothetical protein